jgi:hypothetical protein
MAPTGCAETSAWNYHYTLRNLPEDIGTRLLRGGRLNSLSLSSLSFRNFLNISTFRSDRVQYLMFP